MGNETEIFLAEAGQVAADAELATAAAGIRAQLPDWVLALDCSHDQQLAQARSDGDDDRVALLERHVPLLEDGELVCQACVIEHEDYLASVPTLDGIDLNDTEHLLYPCAVLRRAGVDAAVYDAVKARLADEQQDQSEQE